MWEKNNDEQSHDKTQSSKRWFNKSTLSTAFGSQKDKPSIEHASHGCSNQMEIARDKDRTGCKNKPNDGGQGHSSRHYAVVHYSKQRLRKGFKTSAEHEELEDNHTKTSNTYTRTKELDLEIPKLRETNSTLCQSPKAFSRSPPKASEFKRLKMLGRGKFGDVYLVKHIQTGFVAAMKIIRKADLLHSNLSQSKKAINQLIREVKLQAYMKHPNLIKLYDFFADEYYIYLLLQLACDGQLYSLLERNGTFNEETVSILIREVTEGVQYMHSKAIIHRDIKLENIVLCHGMAKLCDFGWSVYCSKDYRSTLCGTPLYFSPQVLKGKQYNEKIDTWALGALTYELFTAQNAFGITKKEQLSKIITEDFEMEVGSPELRSFVTFILRKNPNKRPDAETIMKHPFLRKYLDLETSDEITSLVYRKRPLAQRRS